MTKQVYLILCAILAGLCLAKPLDAALPKSPDFPQTTGVCVHGIYRDFDEHLALMKEAGFGWVRKDLDWASVEKQKGVYDFSKYDTIVDGLNTAGIKVILILDYHNPFYDENLSPYTFEGRQAFANFAKAAAQHFSHRDVVWEIYNEPNWGFWKPAPHIENYLALATVVTHALRDAAPHQAIIAPALAGPTDEKDKVDGQYAYLNLVLQSKIAKNWDAISIHPYRGKRPPEDVYNEMPRLKKLLAKNSIKAPLVFTEWGYHTSDKGVDETTEAEYAVRSFLITNSLHMPFSTWYNWQEKGDDTSDAEQKFGLIRDGSVDHKDEDAKKPAFHAVSELNATLNGYTFDTSITASNGIYCQRYKNKQNYIYIAWTSNKGNPAYNLSLPHGKWQITRILEDSDIITTTGQEPVNLQLGSMPLIVKQLAP